MRFFFAFSLLLSAACVVKANSAQDTLRGRGSHDLQCAPERLMVRNIGGTSYEVAGCGGRRNYTCNSDGSTCIPEGQGVPPEPPPPQMPRRPAPHSGGPYQP